MIRLWRWLTREIRELREGNEAQDESVRQAVTVARRESVRLVVAVQSRRWQP